MMLINYKALGQEFFSFYWYSESTKLKQKKNVKLEFLNLYKIDELSSRFTQIQ